MASLTDGQHEPCSERGRRELGSRGIDVQHSRIGRQKALPAGRRGGERPGDGGDEQVRDEGASGEDRRKTCEQREVRAVIPDRQVTEGQEKEGEHDRAR